MNRAIELSRVFSSVRQAVIGLDESSLLIIFANPVAKSSLGFDPTGKSAMEIIACDILNQSATNYKCGTTIVGRAASISVVKQGGTTLLFFDFVETDKHSSYITQYIINNLRNCAMGIKMSADRFFTIINEGELPSEKHISIFYHYYYRLVRALSQIDNVNMLKRGEMVFSPSPTDIVKLCEELTDTTSLLCSNTGVNIKFISDEKELIAVVDSSKIEYLLLNLFANSLQHTSSGNNITLTLQRSGNKIILSLDDDGEGISQEVLPSIFDLPKDSSNSELEYDGFGLGLYISFGIVQLKLPQTP